MSELPPPLPPPKKPLEIWFWIALALPLLLVGLTVALGNSAAFAAPLVLLVISAGICPLLCGFRLAFLWSDRPGTQILLGFALMIGLGCFYLAVFFAGCITLI